MTPGGLRLPSASPPADRLLTGSRKRTETHPPRAGPQTTGRASQVAGLPKSRWSSRRWSPVASRQLHDPSERVCRESSMRTIRVADPSDWITRQVPRRPERRRSRLASWAATLPVILLVPALLLPYVPAAATSPSLSVSPASIAPRAVGQGTEAPARRAALSCSRRSLAAHARVRRRVARFASGRRPAVASPAGTAVRGRTVASGGDRRLPADPTQPRPPHRPTPTPPARPTPAIPTPPRPHAQPPRPQRCRPG
jgi:hypothetical protein